MQFTTFLKEHCLAPGPHSVDHGHDHVQVPHSLLSIYIFVRQIENEFMSHNFIWYMS